MFRIHFLPRRLFQRVINRFHVLAKLWRMYHCGSICVSLIQYQFLFPVKLLLFRCASHCVRYMSEPSTQDTNRPISVWIPSVVSQGPYHSDTSSETIISIKGFITWGLKEYFKTWLCHTDNLIIVPGLTSDYDTIIRVLTEPIQLFQREHVPLVSIIPYLATYLLSFLCS